MKKQPTPQYDEHPSLKWVQAVVDNLEARTGKTLEAWVKILKAAKLPDRKTRIAWLRTEHKLGMPTATMIAEELDGASKLDYKPDNSVEQMYSGKKAGLFPLYEQLLAVGKALGPDVTITPTSTTVPLRRQFVFANIKPTTNTRIDLGLALKDTAATGRLIDTGGLAKGDRITHRIGISTAEEIDDEVRFWLRRAYELDTPKK